jgi:acyl-CoA thioester hydrolase
MTKPPFKFSARTRVGFSDTDAQGVVYYGRYNPYFDFARVEYLRALGLLHHGGRGIAPPSDTTGGRDLDHASPLQVLAPGEFVMRANDVEYFAPARFDDEIEVYVRVSRIGNTSLTVQFAAYRAPDDALMVTAHQTMVYVDLAERTKRTVPDEFRHAILELEGDDVEH